jgi:transcriptional regulator
MYLPKHFDQPSVDVLHELMRAQGFATLVTLSPDGLNANHIPLHLSAEDGPLGTLRGHVARANPVWRESSPEMDVLVIFQGPDAYITPSWYPTKAEHGKAVPTWNYAVAHAYGKLRVCDDVVWLRRHLAALTDHNEAAFAEPWQVSDAPADYTEKMMAAIVGIEIEITRLTGKWKVSQNQPATNQAGVVQALRASGEANALAMAALVESAGNAS